MGQTFVGASASMPFGMLEWTEEQNVEVFKGPPHPGDHTLALTRMTFVRPFFLMWNGLWCQISSGLPKCKPWTHLTSNMELPNGSPGDPQMHKQLGKISCGGIRKGCRNNATIDEAIYIQKQDCELERLQKALCPTFPKQQRTTCFRTWIRNCATNQQ